jgi:NADPH:quinone reductase-like Zn-dependent oxidoreductase
LGLFVRNIGSDSERLIFLRKTPPQYKRRFLLLIEQNGVFFSRLSHNENLYLPLITAFSSSKKVIFPMPLDIKASIVFIQNLVEIGHFKPVIDRVYPLDDIAEAFRYVLKGQKIGNVIISMD